MEPEISVTPNFDKKKKMLGAVFVLGILILIISLTAGKKEEVAPKATKKKKAQRPLVINFNTGEGKKIPVKKKVIPPTIEEEDDEISEEEEELLASLENEQSEVQ